MNDQYFTVQDLVNKSHGFIKIVRKKVVIFFYMMILFSVVGVVVSLFYPIKYKYKITFVVEESKQASSGLAAIAGQFGFDLSGSGGGSIFSGDNILVYLRSHSLCKEVLLTPYDENTNLTLADKYIETQGLKEKWQKKFETNQITFSKDPHSTVNNRLKDSLLNVTTSLVLKKSLSVSRPDRKTTFIEVESNFRDEKLSHLFTDRLVKIATEKYVYSKIRVKAENVERLQRRADSLMQYLNSFTYGFAKLQQGYIDLNPALKSPKFTGEIYSRDKAIASAIYSEVLKNLEISRVSLSQITPSIEIVDFSSLPLEVEYISIKEGVLFSVLIALIVYLMLCVLLVVIDRIELKN